MVVVVACLVAAGAGLLAALYAFRGPRLPGRPLLGVLMLSLGAWSALSALHALLPDLVWKVRIAQAQYLAIASAPLMWLLVARRGVGHRPLSRHAVALLALVPALTVALAWTNPAHGAIWRSVIPVGSVLVYLHGPWFWLAAAYNYTLLFAALITLVRARRRAPPSFRSPLHILLVAACLPWVGNALYLFGAIPVAGLDPTPLTFTASGLLVVWGLSRRRLFDLQPIARDAVIEAMSDGVIALDHQRRIVDVNPAARRMCGLSDAAVGQQLGLALPHLAAALQPEHDAEAASLLAPFGPAGLSVEARMAPVVAAGRSLGWLVVLHDVTAQHSLARQLRAEHEFARQVMQTMGEGLTVTDAAGRFTFVNDAYARLFGYAPADLIGRSPIELTIDDDRAALDAARTARAEGRSSTYPARLRRADNQIVDVQVTGTPRFVDGEFAGSIAVVTDLSERVARERALHAAEQTLRSFFDSAGVMMGIVEVKDEDIRHITDNALAASFFGTTVTEMRGQWASTIGIPPETRARWLEAYRQSAALGGPVHFETVHRTTGGVRWFAATVCPLGSGELGGTRYSYVATDVTAQKRTEQQLRVAQGHLESANTQLRELARTDGLTRLANRTAFDQELTAEVARATRYPAPLSVLLIDIDAFKPYNDVYGHQAGDAVLRTVGLIFQEQSRQNDLAARYGGEEFAIILPNTDEAESVLVAERIRRSVERTAWPQRGITVSIGVVTFQPPMVTEELIKLADAALYAAKAQGRNRVVHAGVLPPQPAVA